MKFSDTLLTFLISEWFEYYKEGVAFTLKAQTGEFRANIFYGKSNFL